MATLDQRGLVNDGTNNLTVGGTTVVGSMFMTTNVLPGSGTFGAAGYPGSWVPIPAPGFYQAPVTSSAAVNSQRGAGGFTGSLPSAAQFPGGEILITDTVGVFPYILTCSVGNGTISMMANLTTGSAFVATVGSLNGSKLTVAAGGTVGLWSDTKGWVVCAISGTVNLTT